MNTVSYLPKTHPISDFSDVFFTTVSMDNSDDFKFSQYQKLVKLKTTDIQRGKIISKSFFHTKPDFSVEEQTIFTISEDQRLDNQNTNDYTPNISLSVINSFDNLMNELKRAKTKDIGYIIDRFSEIEEKFPDSMPSIIEILYKLESNSNNIFNSLQLLERLLTLQNFDISIDRNVQKIDSKGEKLISCYFDGKKLQLIFKSEVFDDFAFYFNENDTDVFISATKVQYKRSRDDKYTVKDLKDFVDPSKQILSVCKSKIGVSIVQKVSEDEISIKLFRKQFLAFNPKTFETSYKFKSEIDKVFNYKKFLHVYLKNGMKYDIDLNKIPFTTKQLTNNSIYYDGICFRTSDTFYTCFLDENENFYVDTYPGSNYTDLTKFIPPCSKSNVEYFINKICYKYLESLSDIFDDLMHYYSEDRSKVFCQNPEKIVNLCYEICMVTMESNYNQTTKNHVMTLISRLIVLNLSYVGCKKSKFTFNSMTKIFYVLKRIPKDFVMSMDTLFTLIALCSYDIYKADFVKDFIEKLVQISDLDLEHLLMKKSISILFLKKEKFLTKFDNQKLYDFLINKIEAAYNINTILEFDSELVPFFDLYLTFSEKMLAENHEFFRKLMNKLRECVNSFTNCPVLCGFIMKKINVMLEPLITTFLSQKNSQEINEYFCSKNQEHKMNSKTFDFTFQLVDEPKFSIPFNMDVPILAHDHDYNFGEINFNGEPCIRNDYQNELNFEGTVIEDSEFCKFPLKGTEIIDAPKLSQEYLDVCNAVFIISKSISICLESFKKTKIEEENSPLLENIIKTTNQIKVPRQNSGTIVERSSRKIISRNNTCFIDEQTSKEFISDIILNKNSNLIENLKNFIKTVFKKVPSEIEETERYSFCALLWRSNLISKAMKNDLDFEIIKVWKLNLKVRTELMRAKQNRSIIGYNELLKEVKSKSLYLLGLNQDKDLKNSVSNTLKFLLSEMMMSEIGFLINKQEKRIQIHDDAVSFCMKLVDKNYIPLCFKHFLIEWIDVKSKFSTDKKLSEFLISKSDDYFFNSFALKFINYDDIFPDNIMNEEISNMLKFVPYYDEIHEKLKFIGSNTYQIKENRYLVSQYVDVIRYQYQGKGDELMSFFSQDLNDETLGILVVLGAEIFEDASLPGFFDKNQNKMLPKELNLKNPNDMEFNFLVQPPSVNLPKDFDICQIINGFGYKNVKNLVQATVLFSFLEKACEYSQENKEIVEQNLRKTKINEFCFQKIFKNLTTLQNLKNSFWRRINIPNNTPTSNTFMCLCNGVSTENVLQTNHFGKSFFVYNNKIHPNDIFKLKFDIKDRENNLIWIGFINEKEEIIVYDVAQQIYASNSLNHYYKIEGNPYSISFEQRRDGVIGMHVQTLDNDQTNHKFYNEKTEDETFALFQDFRNNDFVYPFVFTLNNKCEIHFEFQFNEVNAIEKTFKSKISNQLYNFEFPKFYIGKTVFVKNVGEGKIIDLDYDNLTTIIKRTTGESEIFTFNAKQCVPINQKQFSCFRNAQEILSLFPSEKYFYEEKLLRTTTKLCVFTARKLISKVNLGLNAEEIIKLISFKSFYLHENNFKLDFKVDLKYFENLKIVDQKLAKIDGIFPKFINDYDEKLRVFFALYKLCEMNSEFPILEIYPKISGKTLQENKIFFEMLKFLKNIEIKDFETAEYYLHLCELENPNQNVNIGALWQSICYKYFNENKEVPMIPNRDAWNKLSYWATCMFDICKHTIPYQLLNLPDFNYKFKLQNQGKIQFNYLTKFVEGKDVKLDSKDITNEPFIGDHLISFDPLTNNEFELIIPNNSTKEEIEKFESFDFKEIDLAVAEFIFSGANLKKFDGISDWIIGIRIHCLTNATKLPLVFTLFDRKKAREYLEEEIDKNENHKETLEISFDRFDTPKFTGRWNGQTMFSQYVEQVKDVKDLCDSCRPWYTEFVGEGAFDAGGPMRESIAQIAEELNNPNLGVFELSPNSILNSEKILIPNFSCDEKFLSYAGSFICCCMITDHPHQFLLPDLFWNYIFKGKIEIEDLLEIDAKINEREDKEEYFNKLCEKLEIIRNGFLKVLPNTQIISMMSEKIIKTLCCGDDTLTLEKLSPYIEGVKSEILIKCLSLFSSEELKKFLEFVTGSSTIPSGHFRIKAHNYYMDNNDPIPDEKKPLPVAHTCSSDIDIPDYENPAILAEKLRMAMETTLINDSDENLNFDFLE